jgi:hypothetical protein
VEALVQVLSSSQDMGVLHSASAALATICSGASAGIRQRAAGAGAVEALLRVLGSSQDAQVRHSAMWGIVHICSGP